MSFSQDLSRFGPASNERLSLAEARAYCADFTRRQYENFHVVTLLTPAPLRPAFEAVYSFCRWADNLGDEIADRSEALRLLGWWRTGLDAMFQGRGEHPVYQALAPVVAEYGIPAQPFHDLISAFELDQHVVDYDTMEQLHDYCRLSANPVGHLVLYLGRSFNAENAVLSDATCTALQLANHWQDVARDHAIGRIYLPRADRERFGVGDEVLRSGRSTPEFLRLMAHEVSHARALFHQGWPLVGRVPRALAVDIDLFTRGGLAILDRIEAIGYDVLARRPKLTKGDKARLLGRALVARYAGPLARAITPPRPPASSATTTFPR